MLKVQGNKTPNLKRPPKMPFGSFTVWHAQEKEQMQFKFLLHTEATLIILLIAYKRCGDRRFVFTE